jgi:hypothetical protein
MCKSDGAILYEHLNFEKIATEVVRVEGEEEALTSMVVVCASGEQFWEILKRALGLSESE